MAYGHRTSFLMSQTDFDSLFAGLFLIGYGIVGLIGYVFVIRSMARYRAFFLIDFRMCRDIAGFRFLVSQAVADVLLVIQASFDG